MRTKTQSYQLRGNSVIDVPVIGNLISDELGEEVISKLNERFKDVKNIEYTQKHKLNEPIQCSNIPRVLAINNILMQLTNGQIRVLSPEYVVRYWDAVPDKGFTYADTDSIVIYSNEGPNEDSRQKVLSLIEKESKLPLIVSGLDVERSNNDYGFTFIGTDYMKVTEAPFLEKEGRVRYDSSKDKLVSSDEGVCVLTPHYYQSGLRRLCRDRSENLNAGDGSLFSSDFTGRVQLISGETASKNLEEYLEEYVSQANKAKEEYFSKLKVIRYEIDQRLKAKS